MGVRPFVRTGEAHPLPTGVTAGYQTRAQAVTDLRPIAGPCLSRPMSRGRTRRWVRVWGAAGSACVAFSVRLPGPVRTIVRSGSQGI